MGCHSIMSMLIAVIAASTVICMPVNAQVVDGSWRPSTTPGTYRVGIAAGYTPYGEGGVFVDNAGNVNRWAQETRQSEITANAAYTFSERLYAQIETRFSSMMRAYSLEQGGFLQQEKEESTAFSTVSEVRLSLPQYKDIVPQISLLAGYPWSGGTVVTLGITNDPVLLQGAIQYLTSFGRHDPVLSVSGRAGMVVNDSMSFVFVVKHTIPHDELQIPSTMLTIGVTHSLGHSEHSRVSFLTNQQSSGNQTRTGFTIKLDHTGSRQII